MRLAAQAWRPRAIAPAYGRGILNSRLPYFDHEPNAQESDRRQPVYDYGSYHHLSLRYQHQDLEPRATSNGDRSQLRKGCSVNFASSVQIQTIVAEALRTWDDFGPLIIQELVSNIHRRADLIKALEPPKMSENFLKRK